MQLIRLFAVFGAVFLVLAIARMARAGSAHPQAKTWLIVGVLFCLVACWLWLHAPGA